MLSETELFRAVRDAAQSEYDVLGFLGQREDAVFVYLAREYETRSLVALKVESEGSDASGEPQFSIEVARELDASIPDVEALCPRCANKLRRWARFCTQCGMDVSGVSASSGSTHTRNSLLSAVRNVAGSDYDVLGEMSRAEGGGLVYFARELSSGKIVALRLNREAEEEYSLNVTRVLKPIPKRTEHSVETPRISLVQRPSPVRHRVVEVPSYDSLAGQRESPPPVPKGSSGSFEAQGALPPLVGEGKGKGAEVWSDSRFRIAIVVIVVLVVALAVAVVG